MEKGKLKQKKCFKMFLSKYFDTKYEWILFVFVLKDRYTAWAEQSTAVWVWARGPRRRVSPRRWRGWSRSAGCPVGRRSASPSPEKVRNNANAAEDWWVIIFLVCDIESNIFRDFKMTFCCVTQDLCTPGAWAPTCSSAPEGRTTSGAPWRWPASSWRTVQYWWRPAEGSTQCFWSKTSRRADVQCRRRAADPFGAGAFFTMTKSGEGLIYLWLPVLSRESVRGSDPFTRTLFLVCEKCSWMFCRSWQIRDYFF